MSAAAAVQAAVVIADTVNTIVSAAERRKYMEAFSMFSANQQILLADQVAAAQNQTEKLNILANAYYQSSISGQKDQFKKQTIQYAIIVGIALMIGSVGVIYYKRN